MLSEAIHRASHVIVGHHNTSFVSLYSVTKKSWINVLRGRLLSRDQLLPCAFYTAPPETVRLCSKCEPVEESRLALQPPTQPTDHKVVMPEVFHSLVCRLLLLLIMQSCNATLSLFTCQC